MKKTFYFAFITLLLFAFAKPETSKFNGKWISKEKGKEGYCKVEIQVAKDSITLKPTDFSCYDDLILAYDMEEAVLIDKQIDFTLKQYSEDGETTDIKSKITLISDNEIEISYHDNYYKKARYIRE